MQQVLCYPTYPLVDVCVLCRLSNPFTAVTKWDLLVGRLSKTCKQQQQPLILNIKTAKLLITGLLISRHYVFSLNVFSNWTLSQSSFRIHHSECWHDYTLYVAIDDVVSAPYAIGRRLHLDLWWKHDIMRLWVVTST